MPERLSALDASFLYLEGEATPMHVGGVAVFTRPRAGFDYEWLLALFSQRLAFLPRYRQRVIPVPGGLARPVWVDDTEFDLSYHVRRSALPAPGSDEQLFELVARLMSRPLDRQRPLWEAYIVEGLADDRFALITKTHQAVVDGISTIEIGQLIMDTQPEPREHQDEGWIPRREPTRPQLVLDAVTEAIRQPSELVDNVRLAAKDAASTASKVVGAVGELTTALRTAIAPPTVSPLNAPVSKQRRYAGAQARLADLRAVRLRHGGTVNDVVLAAISGALREWLLSRGATVSASTTVRALAPMAVRDPDTGAFFSGLVGNEVAAYLVDLPVGEPNPVLRLRHVSHAMSGHIDSGRSVAASALSTVSGFAPATLHSLGARAASALSSRIFNLVVTNSPGPQHPLYAGQAQLAEMYPVIPLAHNQALAIGVSSYDGGIYFGFNADRDAVSDVANLARMVEESVDELRDTAR
ncbi:WS/DGAT/MGAT family acyltransferase [Tamaricihabitans halophyticus]|uniref:Diacylglycerol O-acyltransferase n=1 Tax=Tamaricihabitans halophyticus TaxID=1262583 RepID=A0A4V2ST30_9PSEU|nr:wax ester/triacylglycerol synthase family O-acyltransferase [Tamaricihabitans halophyticus]TCP49216.1 WS/DGAT/MGAT family acyltransferase [Tamaricihabitans halophyticus]